MKISYSNKKVEKICEDFSKAVKELGKQTAYKLADLLNALEAAINLNDMYGLPQYRMHPLKQNRRYQYSFVIDKSSKWRLIVYPLDNEGNLLTDNSNEKEMLIKAVRIEILEVSEHYE